MDSSGSGKVRSFVAMVPVFALAVSVGGLAWTISAGLKERRRDEQKHHDEEQAQLKQRNSEYRFKVYEACYEVARLGVRLSASKTADDRDLWDMEAILWSQAIDASGDVKPAFDEYKRRLHVARNKPSPTSALRDDLWLTVKNCAIDIGVLCRTSLCKKVGLDDCPEKPSLACSGSFVSAR